MRINEDYLDGLEFPDYEERPSPTFNITIPHQILVKMTDAEIDAHVDKSLENANDDGIFHIGIAPFNRYVGLPAYIVYWKQVLKDTRDIMRQHL